MNLLIVNDEEFTADIMKNEMDWEDFGINGVETAYNAEQAKKFFLEGSVDILLCDIEMPGENGIELLSWVRENNFATECIFLTCHASFEYARDAITLGCQDYILVPTDFEKIGIRVKKIVERINMDHLKSEYAEYGRGFVDEQIQQSVLRNGSKKSQKEMAEEIEIYICSHLGDSTLSVNELGNTFFLHPIHVNRIFKNKLGMSVSQYIIEKRMKLAVMLLKSGKLTLNTVSERVGYKNYSNFNHAFKKFYGCSPSEYEKKCHI